MLRVPFTYKSYSVDSTGAPEEITDILHFHMSAEDLMAWDDAVDGGMDRLFTNLQDTKSISGLRKWFTELVRRSYCEVSPDGRRRIRDEKTIADFLDSAAWEAFFDDLIWQDPTNEKMLFLIQGIFNKDLIDRANTLAVETGKSAFSDLAVQSDTIRQPQDRKAKRIDEPTKPATPWGDLPIESA